MLLLLVTWLIAAFLITLFAVCLLIWVLFIGGLPVYCKSKAKLLGKTVLITGGNAGIGKETAVDMAKRDARVIIACRNEERAKEAVKQICNRSGNHNVTYVKCDLSDFESIHACAQTVLEMEGQLDVLINNAAAIGGYYVTENNGVIKTWPELPRTKQGFDACFGVNHLGHFLLTNLLLDLLKKSAPSRIVNISSDGHKYTRKSLNFMKQDSKGNKYPYLCGYQISKLGNILHTKQLATRLKDSGVTTYSVHPGSAMTGFLVRHSDSYGMPHWLAVFITTILKPFLLSEVAAAQTGIFCAVDESLETVTGKYYTRCQECLPSDMAQDKDLAQRIWDISMELTTL